MANKILSGTTATTNGYYGNIRTYSKYPSWFHLEFDYSLGSVLRTTEFLLYNSSAQKYLFHLGYTAFNKIYSEESSPELFFEYNCNRFSKFCDNNKDVLDIRNLYRNNFTRCYDLYTFLKFTGNPSKYFKDAEGIRISYTKMVYLFIKMAVMIGIQHQSEASGFNRFNTDHRMKFFEGEQFRARELLEADILPYVRSAQHNMNG